MEHTHDHCHGCDGCCHGGGEHARQTFPLARSAGALALMAAGLWTGWSWLHAAAFLLAGADVAAQALRALLRGRVMDERLLMTLASLGAILMGESAEAAAVMALYQAGEWLSHRAVHRSRASIAALMDVRPDAARVLREGAEIVLRPEEVRIGEVVAVHPGERIPLDGVVEEGASLVDTSAVTGEPVPRRVEVGDEVLSGCVNRTGLLLLRVSAAYRDSTVARILQLVEDAAQRKTPTERFITRFARVYTPAVCLAAALLAVLPPLLDGDWLRWGRQALTLLVISCPCALVISVPLTFFSGLGGAARRGVIVKGSGALETLSRVDAVAFDKTGTLSCGEFAVQAVQAVHGSREALLETAALAESRSVHPIARSILAAWGGRADPARVREASEQPGLGVSAVVDGRRVLAGSLRLMAAHGVAADPPRSGGTVVHVAAEGVYLGWIALGDRLRPTAEAAVRGLRQLGVGHVAMLTGDRSGAAREAAAQLGLTQVHAELLPGDKVRLVEAMPRSGAVAFVGDGVNDAPVLRSADVGVAMGGMSSDAAVEAADVVLMHDDPALLPLALGHARRTMGILRQNVALALGAKAAVLALSLACPVPLWLAVTADVGVCLLTVLNALRALK